MVDEDECWMFVETGEDQTEIATPATEIHHDLLGLHLMLAEESSDILNLLSLPRPSVSSQQLEGI